MVNLELLIKYFEYRNPVELLKEIKRKFNYIESFSVGNMKKCQYKLDKDKSSILFYSLSGKYIASISWSGYFRPAISNNKTFGCNVSNWLNDKLNKEMRMYTIKDILS